MPEGITDTNLRSPESHSPFCRLTATAPLAVDVPWSQPLMTYITDWTVMPRQNRRSHFARPLAKEQRHGLHCHPHQAGIVADASFRCRAPDSMAIRRPLRPADAGAVGTIRGPRSGGATGGERRAQFA